MEETNTKILLQKRICGVVNNTDTKFGNCEPRIGNSATDAVLGHTEKSCCACSRAAKCPRSTETNFRCTEYKDLKYSVSRIL